MAPDSKNITLSAAPEIPDDPRPKKVDDEKSIVPVVQIPEPVALNCEIIRREYDIASIVSRVDSGKTILTWSAVPKAKSYHVYKVDNAGDKTFIAETDVNQYEIFLTGDKEIYENIAIGAIVEDENGCLEDLESYVVTTIQT